MLASRIFSRSGSRCLVWLGISALALGAAAPAGAAARAAVFTWTPATGPVAGYLLYASVDGDEETYFAAVDQPNASISLDAGSSLVMSVAAYDTSGQVGPRSGRSAPLRLCPGDFDGDEVLETSDQNEVRACLLQKATGDCAGADMDDNGVVTYADFFAVEVGSDACRNFGPPGSCTRDIDGDGEIGTSDVDTVRSCLGLPAQGSCAVADLDANGTVNSSDWGLISRAVGTPACSS
jgi:hypothetical protein